MTLNVWTHTSTFSLTPQLFTEVPVQSLDERSCILGVLI